VLKNSPILGAGHQLWMMNEVNALVWPAEGGIGSIPQATWDQTVQISLDSGIIPAAPDGAYRTDLADAARALVEGDTKGADFQKQTVEITAGGE
jgi:NitT/TauT family transport system substrate-binding protein